MKRLGSVAALVLLVTLAWAATATAQITTVTFDSPAPPGSSFSFLNGVFLGMDFGTGQWRWESAYNVDPTNHIFFDSPSGTSRTFRFSPAPRMLTSLRVFTSGAGTLTLSDDRGQTLTRAVPTGSMQLVTTGWALASTVITVAFTSGWNLGIDDITYSGAGGADPRAQIGEWSGIINLPMVAVNMMMLRTGQVLMWDGYEFGQDARLWHPALGTFTVVPIGSSNIFCSGQVMLSDGRALVVGGHQANFVGLPDANLFNPVTQIWQPAAPMAFPRWYPTAMTLPDGRVLVVSGSTTCEACIADTPEIYDSVANAWTQLTGARLTMPLYPFMFALPDGRVLYAGSNEANTTTRVLDLASETWTTIDPVIVAGGSAAMYRPGVVLKAGAPANTFRPAEPAVNTAYILDMNQASPAWRQVGSMAFPRAYHTLTLLPDSTVVVTGGVQTTGFSTGQAVYPAEIWDPTSETWSTMASMQVRRSYHSTALLLPDGRVLVAGSGRSGDVNQLNAEIFSPPYLFRGVRPTITSVPATVSVGTAFFVGTPDGNDIESAALVRLGAVTHQLDMDQRYVPLTLGPAVNGLTVQAPANRNLVPPGYYMLFLVNTAGVPSVGAFVQISGPNATAPTVTITSPTSNPTYTTSSSPLALAGTAGDDVGVTQVTWANDRGGSGTAAGTTSWSVGAIALQPGVNVVTVTARDAAGTPGTDTLTVTYTPPDTTTPTVTITSPTTNATYSTGSSPLALAGTAGDNVGVTQVTWANDRGGSGTAAGTMNWSVGAIALQAGVNVLTVTARDAVGNPGTDSLTVTYTPPNNGLVAAYSFNAGAGTTVSDGSGNGNNGVISGATWTPLGRYGAALSFDGVNDWVTVTDAASLDLTAGMTLEAWVYPTVSPTAWRTVVAKEGAAIVAYFLHASSLTANQPAMGVRIGGVEQQLKGGARLTANVWTHLAATYDGTTLRLYVNGGQAASRAQTGAIVATTNPLRIGGNGIWGEYFQGRIDEVRIYNRALSQAEIQSDMMTPLSP